MLVIMLGVTLFIGFGLVGSMKINIDQLLEGRATPVILLAGTGVSLALFFYLARSWNRFYGLAEQLAQRCRAIEEKNEQLAGQNASLEGAATKQGPELVNKVVELEKFRRAMLSVLEDLTETRDEIAAARAYDHAILSSIADGTIVTGTDGVITLLNPAAERLLGVSSADAVGKNAHDVFTLVNQTGAVVPNVQRPGDIAQKGIIARSSVLSVRRADGAIIPVSIEASPVKVGTEILGVVRVFRDISEERRIDQAKSEFVSLASHQLRTPLTAIGWYSELMLADPGEMTPEQREQLKEIQMSNRRMVELVDSLLNVSRIEMGTLRVEPQSIDLEVILNQQLGLLAAVIRTRNIEVKSVVAPDIGTYRADPKLLSIMMLNLLSNACKYTKPNGLVSARLARDGGHILFEVTDTGIGVPEHQKPKIFTKLFRADNVHAEDTEGSGLGLYLVKSILDQIGGTITFTSVENEGSTFTISLPADGMRAQSGARPLLGTDINRMS